MYYLIISLLKYGSVKLHSNYSRIFGPDCQIFDWTWTRRFYSNLPATFGKIQDSYDGIYVRLKQASDSETNWRSPHYHAILISTKLHVHFYSTFANFYRAAMLTSTKLHANFYRTVCQFNVYSQIVKVLNFYCSHSKFYHYWYVRLAPKQCHLLCFCKSGYHFEKSLLNRHWWLYTTFSLCYIVNRCFSVTWKKLHLWPLMASGLPRLYQGFTRLCLDNTHFGIPRYCFGLPGFTQVSK